MKNSDKQAVILAGGLATRLYPRTLHQPKFLVPVAGRPLAAWILGRLAASGFGDVVLCIGHLGDEVRAFVGDGSAFGVRVRYSDEGERRLGTAGALRHALGLLAPLFLVTYGDSYLRFDYASPLADLSAHPESLGTMAVYENRDRYDPSNAEVRDDLIVRYQKRGLDSPKDPGLDHIDYGAMALRREVIVALPEGEPWGLDTVQRELAAAGKLRALVAPTRFFEIGSEEGLADLDAALRGEEGASAS